MRTKAKVRWNSVRTDGLHGKETSYWPFPYYVHWNLAVLPARSLTVMDRGAGSTLHVWFHLPAWSLT